MAQFALTTAVNAARAYVVSSARTAIAGLFAERGEVGRLEEFALQTSSEGSPIPIVHGRMRVSGQVIWATRPTETVQTRSAGGGKGSPKTNEYSYSISLAVGLCEGPIAAIGNIWADSTLLDQSNAVIRVYTGTEDQLPDALIEAIEGTDNAPAYRGLAYVVFEDLPLDVFGNRIPNLSFEVFGLVAQDAEPDLESLVQGVCLIPASGEFAYATQPVLREVGEGFERSENHHTLRAGSDLEAAIDDLQARLPKCRSVALVTSWFGDDLRCGQCRLRPGVETREKTTRPLVWAAAGETRATAHLVSQTDTGPVYGGTPSDETIIDAITLLKARGFAVTLYPFILMDIAGGNGLPDPYGAAEQAVFPWRGRITCHPAAGQVGSVDQTAAADGQVADFFGTASASDFSVAPGKVTYSGPQEWSFNRFILHHAALAAAAGGVESMIIGSEMRGLTQIRSDSVSYPAVARLKALAGQVRILVGSTTKISYAADWSEYFGHQPGDGSGDRLFHLDPLWADPDIDFVGIDWYAPLSDWRDGEAHLDHQAGARSIYDPDYLSANVEGGEGFDWFYASSADRDAQIRTPITDGSDAEPWVYRFKDIRQWWSNAHHDRPGGVRNPSATEWVPGMKPVRLVELGCPAVDKGANQPNVFIDPKSSESLAPYSSSGARDDLIQRRYINALLGYWGEAGRNPVSPLDARPMLDLEHSHVWTWDVRPFPEFPARSDVWADGANWRRGHWLTGRVGQSSLARIVSDIARRAGLGDLDAGALDGVLSGYIIEGPVSARRLLEQLGAVFGFTLADGARGPRFVSLTHSLPAMAVTADQLVDQDRFGECYAFTREPSDTLPAEARLLFHADEGDYRVSVVSARGLDHIVDGVVEISLPALADPALASDWAQALLRRARAEADGARIVLPPSLCALEPGDGIQLDVGQHVAGWRVTSEDGLTVRSVELIAQAAGPSLITGPEPGVSEVIEPASRPLLWLLDLPVSPGEGQARDGMWTVAHAAPWPGELVLYAGQDAGQARERARLTTPAFLGRLMRPLAPGFEGRWDWSGVIDVQLYSGALASRDLTAVLSGANQLAIETASGWEVVAFANAELVGSGRFEARQLLRGLGGSEGPGAMTGARVVVLDGAGAVCPVDPAERGAELTAIAVPAGRTLTDLAARSVSFQYDGVDKRPLSPVHLRARWSGDMLVLDWVRRSRIAADSWGAGEVALGEERERYRLRFLNAQNDILFETELVDPRYTLESTQRLALLGPDLSGLQFEVSQIAAEVGPGRENSAPLDPAAYG